MDCLCLEEESTQTRVEHADSLVRKGDSNPHGFPRQILELIGHRGVDLAAVYPRDCEVKESAIRLLEVLNKPKPSSDIINKI